ncbi:lymphokine-activated killer T-cell-originated protein kinase [Condylostylus longicornis]|uniref:lymphokine-activated killer T-cell-originated protein kinase n=1 Tax=Condylostylus longicornis TaxID=2530218 RepID=UPI00244DC180|nr:lymphokine-activated killer T-cell-originated protein kinase [Condylostylus longicornis]
MDTQTPQKFLRRKHLDNISKIGCQLTIPSSPHLTKLGFGTGVNVWKLERSPTGKNQSPWAIKRLSKTAREQKGNEIYDIRLKAEAEILRKLSHPNIIGFRAFEKSSEGVDSLAIECCTTCLGTILEERCEDDLGPLPANEIWKVVLDISNALKYLHEEAKLLHADLKSFNILIKGDFEICKLCDFGVSLPLNDEGIIDFTKNPDLEYIGTQLWSAPEVIDGETIICSKSDIFSFGLIIYETLALLPPHTLKINDDEEAKENSDITNESLDTSTESMCYGTRPPLPENFQVSDEYKEIIELFFICTNELPEDRPTASVIFKIASDFIKKSQKDAK